MQQERPHTFSTFCKYVERRFDIDFETFFHSFEQLLEFLHALFEIYHNLKHQFIQQIPNIKNRIQEIWSQHGETINTILQLSSGIVVQNILDDDAQTKLREFFLPLVGGIPALIQVCLMCLYAQQICVFFNNREFLNGTLKDFELFEDKIKFLHDQTQIFEELIFQFANNEGNQQELLERINLQIRIIKTHDEAIIRRQFNQFRNDLQELLSSTRTNQNEQRKRAAFSFVFGLGAAILGVSKIVSRGAATVGAGGGILVGSTALIMDARISKQIKQINDALDELNNCEQLAVGTFRKIEQLETRHDATFFVYQCFKYALWISFFVKLYDLYQTNPNYF